jgi:hypothetical protein
MIPLFRRMRFCLLDYWMTPNCHQLSCVRAIRIATLSCKGFRRHALSIGRILFCVSRFVKAKKNRGPGFLTGASNLPREEGMAQRLE